MTPSEILSKARKKLDESVGHFEGEAKKLRTGRAHPSMLEGVMVEAYGVPMPLIQVGNVTAPEAQLLQITPFDPNNLEAITSAIRDNQSLGMNPMDDGRIVRVPVPPLTEERRRDIVKILGQKLEEAMISTRSIRHEAIKDLDQAKKSGSISEDEQKRALKEIDEAMASNKQKAEAVARDKEQEIMTV